MNKRLYRSNSNKMVAGVCGGVGEYFDIDPTIVRLAFVLLVIGAGSGILLYILGAIIIPVAPYYQPRSSQSTTPEEPSKASTTPQPATAPEEETTFSPKSSNEETVTVGGGISLEKTKKDDII